MSEPSAVKSSAPPPSYQASPTPAGISFDPSKRESYYTYLAAGYAGTGTRGDGFNHHGFAAAAGGGIRLSFDPYGNHHGLLGLFIQRAGLKGSLEKPIPGGQESVSSEATARSLGLELGYQFTPSHEWFSASALGALGLVHYSAMGAGPKGPFDAPQGLIFGPNQKPYAVDALGAHLGFTLQGNIWRDVFLLRAGIVGHLGMNPDVEFDEGRSQSVAASFPEITVMTGVNPLALVSLF